MATSFKQAYDGLNTRQKQAVDTLDGPLLVIAGPGTGKTQLLSTRVANILFKTDTAANQILCLTFTNKAAVNMKERIIALTGPAGTKVAAKTFHSFAGEIMSAYPDYFWSGARLLIAPEPIQLDIIESIIAKLPLDNPLALKFAGQYTLLGDVAEAIKLVKEAGLSPDKLRTLIKFNLAYIDSIEQELIEITANRLSTKDLFRLSARLNKLPDQDVDETLYPLVSLSTIITESLNYAIESDEASGKTANCSAWKRRWIQVEEGERGMHAERRRNDWWLKLADVYEAYRQQIHERGFYDYADMLVEVIEKLESYPEILADLRERFAYVMVDEFQDTTPAQLRLARLVSGPDSNIMAVGDDDQSIFKFNGAELNNLLSFSRIYPSTKIIILKNNYRSTQAILDAAQRIISQADNRLVTARKDLKKNLRAAASVKPGKITAFNFASRELQLSRIAEDIRAKYKPGISFAVLARGHDSLIRMAGLLDAAGVPLRYEQASNILDHEMVSLVDEIAQLLLAISSGRQDQTNALIHQIIRSPVWQIKPAKLWLLALASKPDSDWLKLLELNHDKNLSQLGGWFIKLAAAAGNQPLAITLEQIIGLRDLGDFRSPIRDYYLKGARKDTNKYLRGLSAIQLLRALVYEFASTKNEPGLEDLVRFLGVNRTSNRIVADESPFITAEAGVNLLTVHKAKGLEFDHVYIIDATEDNWSPRVGGRKPPANLPLQPAGDDLNDYVRLLYVAATRAKSSLTISSYFLDHSGMEVATSSIVQAAFEVEKITETSEPKLIQILEENLRWPSLDGGSEKAMLKARLEGYSLSVTHLLNFLDIERGGPRYFLERNLLRLPEAKTPSQAYGTAVHTALQTGQLSANRSHFNLKSTLASFEEALKREQLSPDDFTRYRAEGLATLKRLFGSLKYELPKNSLPEQNLRGLQLDKAIINGKLDRVDESASELTIIDYKTGRPLPSFDTKNKTQALKAYRHKTQLIFYALLARNHPKFSQTSKISGQMVYVEASRGPDLLKSYRPTAEEIADLKKLIEAVWASIQSLQWPDISRYSPDLEGTKNFVTDLINKK